MKRAKNIVVVKEPIVMIDMSNIQWRNRTHSQSFVFFK